MAGTTRARARGPADVQARRAAILAAAAVALAEHGYDRVRLRDVARASGSSVGLVQHYFDSREALLDEAFQWVSDRLVASWTALAEREPDPWPRLVALVDGLAAEPDFRRHCVTWTQFCVTSSREPSLRDGVNRIQGLWRQHIAAVIKQGVADGAFVLDRDQDDVTDLLLALIDGCELQVAAGLPGMDAARVRDLVLATARRELGVRG